MYQKNQLYLFIGLSVLLLVLENFRLLAFFRSPADSFVIPVKNTAYRGYLAVTRLAQNVWQFPNFVRVNDDNARLKRENQELALRYEQLLAENKKLKAQLDVPVLADFKLLPAQVLGRARYLDIGVGAKDGVEKGAAVVLGSTLIGRIQSVGLRMSQVMLLSDLEFSADSKTIRGSHGTVIGQSGENVTLSKVLQKDPLFIDDQVFTSGDDGLPLNLLIGKVKYIQSDDVSVYKQAKIEQPLDDHLLSTVFVVKE